MRKVYYIISREYITRVRKKSFILLTLLGPLFFVLLSIGLPLMMLNINKSEQFILVKDDSGFLNALPDSSGIYFTINQDQRPLETIVKEFEQTQNEFDAFVYIPAIEPDKPYGIKLYSKEQISITTRSYIEQIIADQLEQVNLEKMQLKKQDILKLRPKVTINDEIISANKTESGDAMVASGIGYVMGFLIYIVLLIYGSLVMRGVMEEKQNRIVEVILSSVKPFQLMIGKIVGIGLVGLTQFFIWGVLFVLLQFIVGGIFAGELSEFQNLQTNPTIQNGSFTGDEEMILNTLHSLQSQPLFLYFILFSIYFIGGYLLYSALFAAIGSLASDNETDVQMFALPLTMMILVSIFIMMAVIQQPHTNLAFWASIIPFSSPIVMPALLPFHPPVWQIVLSLFLLICGFIFTTWVAAKIYKVGILMYGKKVKMKEVIKWIFYKN